MSSGWYFLEGIDVSMMGVALPSMRAELGLSTASLQWVVSAYVLGYGGFVLLGGRVGDLGCGQGWSTIALARAYPDAEVRTLPVADGGEGTLEAALAGLGAMELAGQRRAAAAAHAVPHDHDLAHLEHLHCKFERRGHPMMPRVGFERRHQRRDVADDALGQRLERLGERPALHQRHRIAFAGRAAGEQPDRPRPQRLREVRAEDGVVVRKLGHKVRLTEGPAEVACTSLYLDDEEWALLSALPARVLRKKRHMVATGGWLVAIDEHEDGTLIAEIDDHDEPSSLVPDWLVVVRDVSNDEAWTGAGLAR